MCLVSEVCFPPEHSRWDGVLPCVSVRQSVSQSVSRWSVYCSVLWKKTLLTLLLLLIILPRINSVLLRRTAAVGLDPAFRMWRLLTSLSGLLRLDFLSQRALQSPLLRRAGVSLLVRATISGSYLRRRYVDKASGRTC